VFCHFPLIVEALVRLRSRSCIIDGEAVVCDDNGVASFDRIRRRRHDGDTFLSTGSKRSPSAGPAGPPRLQLPIMRFPSDDRARCGRPGDSSATADPAFGEQRKHGVGPLGSRSAPAR
jgi:hypothetical protein